MSQKTYNTIFVMVVTLLMLLPALVPATDVSQDSVESQLTEHGRKILEVIKELQAEGELCDVNILVGDRSFRAQKLVLSAGSPYFKAMFTNKNMRGQSAKLITLHDLDAEAFEVIKNYIYTGQITIADSNVVELLKAASLLLMTDIRDNCCKFLRKKVNAINCLGIKYIADKYSCSELLNYASVFTFNAFEEVVKNEEFSTLNRDELIDIISDVRLTAAEDIIYEAVMRWIRYQNSSGGDRTVHLADILQHVRFSQMKPKYLVAVSKDPLIIACKQCRKYVNEAEEYLKVRHLSGGRHEESFLEVRLKPRGSNYLIAVGGLSESYRSTSSVERYDLRIDKWTEKAPINSPRNCLGAAVLDNILYAVGGKADLTFLSSIECYEPHTDKWTDTVKPLQLARTAYNRVAIVNRFLYIIGGSDSLGSNLNSVVKYDPDINEWFECEPLRQKRYGHAVGVLDGYIYALGGTVSGATSNTVEVFDPIQNEWHNGSPMITRRSSFGVTAHMGYLYAVGGYVEDVLSLKEAERYDQRTQKWDLIPSMDVPRYGHGLAVANGLIYAVGGLDSTRNHLNTVEVYDPENKVWSKCAPMLNGRSFFGLVSLHT